MSLKFTRNFLNNNSPSTLSFDRIRRDQRIL